MNCHFTKSILKLTSILILIFTLALTTHAQVSNAPCNTFSPLVSANYSNLTVTSSQFFGDQFSPKANLIDANLTNNASWNFLLAIGSAFVEVKDNNATGANVYPAGTYAGFVVDNNTLLGLFGNVTVSTYLGNTLQESVSGGSLISIGLLSSTGRLGFVTTKNFDRIRFTFGTIGVAGSVSVYYAEVERFCAGATPVCNTNTPLVAPSYPAAIEASHTGLTGITLGTISNETNVVNSNTDDFATIALPVGILASGSIAVKDQITDYPAGYFAGFDVANPTLLSLNLISNITITTYLNGVQRESKAANQLLIGAPLLTAGNRQVVGFVTSQSFDEVRFTVNQVVGVNLGSTEVYNAIIKRFCAGPDLVCNTQTTISEPTYPVFIDVANTGINGVACVGCAVNDASNVIDNNATNYAEIVLTAGVLANGSLAVKDQLTTYPAGTYAGFDIENASLLNANVLGNFTITLLNNGTVVQTGTGSSQLITANTSLLSGTPRSVVGIVSTVAFDEVKVTVANTVSVNLGATRVYSLVLQKGCAGTLTCNSTSLLNTPAFPAVIEGTRTGINTIACVACNIANPINVVTASTTDFARINLTVGVLTSGSISVRDQISVYPAGTTAGFVVRDPNNFLEVNLLSAITITTYLNGVAQESRTAGSLLNIDAILISIGGSSTPRNIGFTTSKPWNEVQITYNNVLGAITYLDVFGAFVGTTNIPFGTPGFNCNYTNPDVNVTYKNVTVTGNVSTNDKVQPGTTYGTAVAVAGVTNPSNDVPTVNADGTYTFTPTAAGVYQFVVPVCNGGVCKNELLTITVLDKNSATNPPTANTDIASTFVNAAVTIKSLANDQPGTTGSALVPSTVVITDLNGAAAGNTPRGGTAVVNTTTGDITYTPATGFVGVDTVRYTVCDNQTPAQCASAFQIITVLPTNAANTTSAADDHISTPAGVAASGNVKTNDTDAEGNTQTVTAQTTTIPGKGTLVLNTNGTYTFTPVAGFTGPVDFAYTTCDNGTPQACASATLHILVKVPENVTAPDVNVTYKNVAVTGNVSTNDKVQPGTTYGTAVVVAGVTNPSNDVPTVNADGTYTFTPSAAGVYQFVVPVCNGSVCKNELLTITVLDKNSATNPPTANTDIASTFVNAAVTIKSLANDQPGTTGSALVPSTAVITDLNGAAAGNTPRGGTAVVNTTTGDITYTPATGFVGVDTVRYTVCDNQTPAQCASAFQIITVLPTNAANTTSAADDHISTPAGVAASGNVKTNDTDAEGDAQTVTAQTTTIAGKGTLVLNADGSYTFTPVAGFTGPVDFAYTTCDNGTPQACASATLHILVKVPENVTAPDVNVTYKNVAVTGNVSTNDKVQPGTTYGTAVAVAGVTNPSNDVPTVIADGTYTFTPSAAGVYQFVVPVCNGGVCKNELLTITVLDPATGSTNPPTANTDVASTKGNNPVTLKTLVNDQPGTTGSALVPSTVVITDLNGAANGNTTNGGTAVVNSTTGDITYTPATGFVGVDTIKYTVCDNQTPAQCASAFQIVTVLPTVAPNSTAAADDHISTASGVVTTGNVKTNDSDPEGNTQTVATQTTTIPGKGTLVLAADGSYIFTPVAGFAGPVDFVYTTCDNGTPQACASATLHILVKPAVPDFTPSNDIDALSFNADGATRDLVVNISEIINQNNNGAVVFRIRKLSAFNITYNTAATTANVFGGSLVNNSDWSFTENASFITCTLKAGVNISGFGVSPVGFTITRKPGIPVNTSQNITVTIIDGSGGDSNNTNNSVVTTITAN
ncbi:beta strand repeat-containing protein [Ferruginibacter yonginensis]|uniref:Beta strand repeat-containing protein n=1 Tax=Ferruginibacter yonginensis TaxID=1310416 RepID=A0ABV8QMN1_9BACT